MIKQVFRPCGLLHEVIMFSTPVTLETKAVLSFETSGNSHPATECHNPKTWLLTIKTLQTTNMA